MSFLFTFTLLFCSVKITLAYILNVTIFLQFPIAKFVTVHSVYHSRHRSIVYGRL